MPMQSLPQMQLIHLLPAGSPLWASPASRLKRFRPSEFVGSEPSYVEVELHRRKK